MNISDITITSIETITAFDVSDGSYLFTLDELQSATIAQSEEKTDVTGKGGRKLTSLKRNKAVTISGNNGLVSGGLMAVQTGSSFESKVTTVMWTDYLTVSSNSATTTYKAIGTAGNEIETVYIKNADGTLGTALTQDSTASAGKFAYSPSTKELTFSGISDNTEIVVFYMRQIQASVLENSSENYSGKATLYIDAFGEDTCSNVYRLQFYVPKADFSGEFSLEMSDSQTVHAFEAEAEAGSKCSANASNLWTYTIFGANTVDAPSLSSIAVTTAPTKTSYSAGEAFNASGMVVTATYSDTSTKPVTDYTFAPTGALTAGTTKVTITYSEGGVTKTVDQAITVSA